MAVKREPRKVSAASFNVAGANNGDYGILIVPKGKSGLTISSEGTAASAVVNIGFNSPSGIVNYENGTLAAGGQLAIAAGEGAVVYAIVTASTSTTALGLSANTW